MIPEPWEFALLALASFRVWWLLANDDITAPLRRWLFDRWPTRDLNGFVECPWCLGFWVTLGWWGAWSVWDEALYAAAPFALAAGVAIVATAVSAYTPDN